MANSHPYHFGTQGDPNPAHLDRYFSTVPDDAESLAFREALEADEFMKAAFGSLSAAEYAVVKEIATSVNTRISRLTARRPWWKRYFIPALLLLLALFTLWLFLKPSAPTTPEPSSSPAQAAPVAAPQKPHSPAPAQPAAIHETPSEKPEPTPVAAPILPVAEKEVPPLPPAPPTHPEPGKEPKEAAPDPVPQTRETVLPAETSREFASDHNALILLRVGNAQVMSKLNLAEAESVAPDSRRAVNDPNIGSPTVSSTRQVRYKIEDMPSYTGGDQGLIGYIQRQLSSRITLPRSQVVPSVVVRFEVNGRGKVSNVSVLDNVPEAMEKEIIQVIREAPGWQPGKKSGKKGSLEYSVFISFY